MGYNTKVIIDEKEYLDLLSLRELTDQKIGELARQKAREIADEERGKVEIRVDIYAEGRHHDQKDKLCLSVQPQPYRSIKEDLKPLAQKVCYMIEDNVSYLLERDKKDAIARRRAYEYSIQNIRLWFALSISLAALIIAIIL